MNLWRIKLNSGRAHEVDWDEARAHCREVSIVGVGWGCPGRLTDESTLDDVVAEVATHDDWTPTGPRIIRRLAQDVVDDDFIWTRDRRGAYWLGRITGHWRYDASDDGWRWDLNNIRPCAWLDTPLRDFDIPGAVVRSFAGRGQTLQRIKDGAALEVTDMLWRRAHGDAEALQPLAPERVLSGLLGPIDVEDLVLIYLQAQGWLLMPSTRMNDTVMYEAALRRRGGQLAVVSVKSGLSAWVPIPELAEAAAQGRAQAFAYSTEGLYSKPPADFGVHPIDRQDLLAFMRDDHQLLPPRISRWL
ncbi:MAG: hypothetical protein JWQ20_1221 [Conexibacter sp.]|nr:hypothetical protein [Conexibacter sp.]